MNKLRTARFGLGINLGEAANRAGTNIGNLSRIERGRQFPSPKLALRLCQVYGVTLEDIYQDAEPHIDNLWRDAGRDTAPPEDRAA
jgi:DNA-binding XRE family transcriptional regulator